MRRSQPVKPQATKIDNQTLTTPTFFGTAQNEMDAGSQTLSALVIVANVLTCEPARTSILFLGAKRFSVFGFTPACNSFRWANLFAHFYRPGRPHTFRDRRSRHYRCPDNIAG